MQDKMPHPSNFFCRPFDYELHIAKQEVVLYHRRQRRLFCREFHGVQQVKTPGLAGGLIKPYKGFLLAGI